MEGLTPGLQNMRENGDMCDILIKSSNSAVHRAHGVMLAAASPVFKAMLTKEFKEKQTKVRIEYFLSKDYFF